jgi:hypothetical protein
MPVGRTRPAGPELIAGSERKHAGAGIKSRKKVKRAEVLLGRQGIMG